jgi:hypothetical protein
MREPFDELRTNLEEGRQQSSTLLERLAGGADPLEIVTLLESLAVLDGRRGLLLDHLRGLASAERQRQEERSIRQFVLGALADLETPQTTGFLEDYVWATELVEVKSRGTGSLRRDEFRAWHRRHARPRIAYIVPCLDSSGRPVPRWLSRSDWALAQRMSVGRAEEMWTTRGVCALLDAYVSATNEERARFLPIIARWASEVDDGTESIQRVLSADYLFQLRDGFRNHLRDLEGEVVPAQEKAAAALADAEEKEVLWGRREQ